MIETDPNYEGQQKSAAQLLLRERMLLRVMENLKAPRISPGIPLAVDEICTLIDRAGFTSEQLREIQHATLAELRWQLTDPSLMPRLWTKELFVLQNHAWPWTKVLVKAEEYLNSAPHGYDRLPKIVESKRFESLD